MILSVTVQPVLLPVAVHYIIVRAVQSAIFIPTSPTTLQPQPPAQHTAVLFIIMVILAVLQVTSPTTLQPQPPAQHTVVRLVIFPTVLSISLQEGKISCLKTTLQVHTVVRYTTAVLWICPR